METATNGAVELLLSQGLPGVVIGALAFALVKLFNKYTSSLEKRVDEAAESRTAIERNTAAITALTEVVKAQKG